MSLKTLPILFLNLGGEMIYILEQRLRAQNVSESKMKKVLHDIMNTMLNKKFMEELFKPQEMYSRAATRTVFDRIAHVSIMRLNSASMDKLYDLMTMAFKQQVSLAVQPYDILMVTLNHMDVIREFASGSDDALELVENVYTLLRENYENLSQGQLQLIRHTLLGFLQDLHIRVSIFLKQQRQLTNGRFVLPLGGRLGWGVDAPGLIRKFDENGEETTSTFPVAHNYHLPDRFGSFEPLGDRMTQLGANMYATQHAVTEAIPQDLPKPNLSKPVLTERESLSKPDQTANAELKLLQHLIIGDKKSNQSDFRLNLFNTDEEESAAEVEYAKKHRYDVLVDASKRPQRNDINKLMDEFSIENSPGTASKGDDLLELMDNF